MTEYEYGVRVFLNGSDDFLRIRETLTRMGIAATNPKRNGPKGKSLIQSCHILCERGQYFIVHFKELFKLDELRRGTEQKTILTEDDYARRNSIAFLLQEWKLLTIAEPEKYEDNCSPFSKVKIIPFREKDDWQLIAKYTLGKKRT